MSEPIKTVSVMSHTRPAETADVLRTLLEAARENEVEVHFDREEAEKHEISERPWIKIGNEPNLLADLCIVLGGDGTILNALRRYLGTDCPVFAINFGEVGFLSTAEIASAGKSFERAFSRDFEVLSLPTVEVEGPGGIHAAINEISVQRRAGSRIAHLGYGIGGREVARVRCDGLVAATPAGSTGYNLANDGPVLAWGVEGYVISFIAPHALAARPLVVAPQDVVMIENLSTTFPVEVSVDGHTVDELRPGASIEVSFKPSRALLAQLHGTTFYSRLHDKFGRLAV